MDNRPTPPAIMNIIAIECSHPKASLCLAKNTEICQVKSWETSRNHDPYLFPGLQDILKELGDEPIDTILVGSGPGSYGGVRVAIAAASGIAMVKGCKLAAISSWTQLADDSTLIISDAKRGGWTLRQHDGNIEVLNQDEMLQLQESGQLFSTLEKQEILAAQGLSAANYELVPTAQGLISTWFSMSDTEKEEACKQAPSPIYVRPPHITKAKRKPWEC